MCLLRGALRVYPYVTNHALLQKWSLLSLLPSGSHFLQPNNQCSSQPGPSADFPPNRILFSVPTETASERETRHLLEK